MPRFLNNSGPPRSRVTVQPSRPTLGDWVNHRLGIGDSLLTRCGRASGQFVDSKVTDEQLLELLCVSVGIIDVYTEQTCVLTRARCHLQISLTFS